MGSGLRRNWRRAFLAGTSGSLALLATWPFGGAASAAGSSGPSTTGAAAASTTTTLPPLPAVPLSITAGQPAQTLLANALALLPVESTDTSKGGVASATDSTALAEGVAAIQLKLNRDSVTARKMTDAAAQASERAAALLAQADSAQADYRSLDAAVKNAVRFLYTNGPTALTINPAAGDKLAYAADYADTAITPTGALKARSNDAKAQRRALAAAKKAEQAADRAAAKATKALASEQATLSQLDAELQARAGASAREILADRAALAAQAGSELLSASALQFTPSAAIPPPLSTTSVALEWAFAELGKPYVWAATGPDTFDCSGLTQFVWRQAGVTIPRVAADQDAWSFPVPLSQLLPGDLVFYGTTDIHHVGIYIGDGLMINAPHTGDVVRVSSIWWSDLAGFGRVHAPGTPVPLHNPPTVQKPAPPAVVLTAGPVPSQRKPPPGWKPKPGSSTPLKVYPGAPTATTTTTATTVPAPTTTTTTVPAPTTTLGTTTNSVPEATTSTTTTSLP
jgi:cell wall-associated NlpC family hydrolase